MTIRFTYRFFAIILCGCLFLGIGAPVFGHSLMMSHCSTMMLHDSHSKHTSPETDHGNMEMDMNKHEDCISGSVQLALHSFNGSESSNSQNCEMNIDCLCDFDASSTQKEALIVQHVKIPKVLSTASIVEQLGDQKLRLPPLIHFFNSYSPPSLFLVNESFLI